MIKLLTFLLLVGGCWVGFDVLRIRYNEALNRCTQQQIADRKIVENPLCKDLEMRLEFAAASLVDCKLAEKRLGRSVETCAKLVVFQESELVRVWNMMTENYTRVLMFALPVVLFVIHKLFDHRHKSNLIDERVSFINAFQRPYMDSIEAAEPRRIKKRKRLKARSRPRVEVLDDEPEFVFGDLA